MNISPIRKRIFEIIEVAPEDDLLSKIYDFFMMSSIIISIIPLTTKNTSSFIYLDIITVVIFVIDYFLRLITADFKLNKGYWSFLKYPFTLMAIIDLVSILPSIVIMNKGFKILKIFRLFRTFRVFKAFRYSKNVTIILNVFKKQKDSLVVVCWLAVGYVLVSALIIFNVEPETFENFFDAIYWATISLTTVGYGDIYAVSDFGKLLTMISSLFGIAIVALPAGIITAGYMDEINKGYVHDDSKNKNQKD